MTIVVKSVFEEDGEYYLQVYLDECLYDLKMLQYNRIDISEGIDINKTSASKRCDICQYWYVLSKTFSYEPYLCNGCLVLMQKTMNFNDAAVVSVKGSGYRILQNILQNVLFFSSRFSFPLSSYKTSV